MDATSSAYAAVGDYSSLSRDGHRNRDGSQHHIIGPASENLRREMSSLYWDGVRREVGEILLNLRGWQTEPVFGETVLEDEKIDLIQGYDSFIDQISRHARDINERNDPLKSGLNSPKNSRTADISYSEALKQHGLDIYAVRQGYSLKKAVRDTLDAAEPDGDVWQRRALLLLQSAQFLDIDKLTEYRDVIKGASVWRRPAPPQLNLSIKKSGGPEFTPQRCSKCTEMIRGSMYVQINEEDSVFCETCYREYHYGDSAITKKYKTCCLPSEATPQVEMICRCRSSKHKNDKGEPLAKWPLKPQKPSKCGLFSLNRMLAEAKYAETRGKVDAKATLSNLRVAEFRGSKYKWGNPSQLPNLNSEFGTSLGRVDSVESVPLYLRSIEDKYPYGNVHMALRFGPITIENGIENTHGGVIIAIRDLPQLQTIARQDKTSHKCLKLTERNLEKENWQIKKKEWTRTVYSEIRHHGPQRYKAVMKQVVGGAFCGFIDRDAEREISDCLVKESRQLAIDGLRSSQKTRMIEQAKDRIMERLRPYLSSRVEQYLGSLAGRLLDHNVALRWAYDGNTCQTFCDNLIDFGKFGSLFAPVGDDIPSAPLYLMSFVCRPDAYLSEPGETLYNVPHGLVEEYLLKFRYGRHDESDVIDTLQEYWHDWGNFEGPLYHYQDVFPWDCTEAFCGHPGNCATCSVSKHVWAFPFDSWSIITLHLTRARQFYPKTKPPQKLSNSESSSNTEDTQPLAAKKSKGPGTGFMSDLDWFQNRLTILLGQQALLKGATAMARCQTVREAADWIHKAPGGYHDRIKLGGILRAQPFSHHFEKGTYHHYYVAGWSSFSLDDRKKTYEDLRDLRAQLPRAPNGRSGGSSFGTKGDTDVSGGVMVDMSIDSYHLASSIDGHFMPTIDTLSQLAGPSCAGGAACAGSSGCAGGGAGGGGGS